MAPRSARGSISRPTLIWIIVAAFLIASGVGIYLAVRKGSRSTPPIGAAINLDAPPPPAPPADPSSLQSDDGRAQFVDQDDPNRLAGEMLYRRLDPLPRGRYALEEPQLWLFMKDGRTLHVRAAKGNVKFFQGTEKPESGRFEGGVIARIYAKGVATAAVRPDPQAVPPEMLAYTGSLIFDLSLGEFSTPDVVNLSDSGLELQGKGLTIVFNEVRGSVASVELGAVGYLHVRTQGAHAATVREPAPASAAPAVAGAPATAPTASAKPPTPPKIDLYTTEVFGPVTLTIGTEAPQSISADKLFIWARLVDGKLPPNAIAELRAKQRPKPDANAPAPSDKPVAAAPAPQAAPATAAPVNPPPPSLRDRILGLRVKGPGGVEPLTPIASDDALLTWGGRLVATAVETTPPELDAEQVAGRFVSESDQPVLMIDMRSGATVLAESAHYGATTAQTDIRGKDGKPPTIADDRSGHAELPALTLNLKTGVGQSRGPGYLFRRDPVKRTKSGEPREQRVNWTDQSDFEFEAGSKGGAGLEYIRSASFTGSARAIDDKAEVTGDYIQAQFMPSKSGEALLKQVLVKGAAFARTNDPEQPQSLRADNFDMTFKADEKGKDAIPSFLAATGSAVAERTELVRDPKDKTIRAPRKSKLSSNSLEATLDRDAKGDSVVTSAVARDAASFTRSDGVSASGDEISVNVVEQTVDITGPDARVTARGATLTAPDLHLDGGRETEAPDAFYGVVAKGPGRLDHTDPAPPKLEEGQRAALLPDELGRTTLTWTKGMRFNDAKGEGEAVGDVVAVTHPDPFTRNTVRGSRMTMRTVPSTAKTDGGAAKDAKKDEINPLEDVKLLRAEVIADEGAPKVAAEQRIYVVDDAIPEGRRLEKMTYIEGPRLIADEENGTFEVPGRGRALVLDHSVAKDSKQAATPFGSTSGSGTTLIEWAGSLKMNRVTERADVVGGVVITHKPLDTAQKPIVLSSDAVEIRFKLAPKTPAGAVPPAGDKQRDQLVSATATGAVVITSENGTKELSADSASYDAVNDIVEASATQEHSGVTFLDKTKGIPTIARKMRWNLKTDQIDIVEPMLGAVPIK